nr:ribonuclease H-like domain-containing protein [Tanacetum cinerariifolium]
NVVTNSRVTPSWREIVSLTFSEAGVIHVNWISCGHCITSRGLLCQIGGTLSCYKARFMVNDSTHLEGVDIDETFSLVLKPGTIRTVLSLIVYLHCLIHQLDVKKMLSHMEHMVNCNSSQTPIDTESKLGEHSDLISDSTLYQNLAGSLQYLTFTRPDTSYALHQICLYMMILANLISWLLRGVCGYCVFLGNNLLSWSSKHQPTLSHSSAEAKYHGVANVVAETCWLRNLLLQHKRTKHIEIDIHFVRDLVAVRQVRDLHVPSRYQHADIFTKELPSTLFKEFQNNLSIWCPPALTVGGAVILKKLLEKLRDPGKFLISCGFSEIKCKALADLANRAICTPDGIARDVFVPVGKFTFPADFVIIDYERDPRVPLILGRPFLRTARALIDDHGEEMILRDGDERLTLNMRHDTSSYSNQPQKESINMINIFNDSYEDYLEDLFATNHQSGNLTFSFYPDLTSPEVKDDIFDPEGNMFGNEYAYNDPFDSNGEKIKESKLLIDELDLPRSSDFLPFPEYDSFLFENFSEVDSLPSTNNEDKVFNPGILIHENLSKVTTHVTPNKNVKKISNASLILEYFNPPLYELPFYKEVPGSETLLSFSSKNKEKVFKPEILTSKGVHSFLLLELSHRGPKAFKLIKIFESPMEISPCFFEEDIRILDVPCLHFYPP